MAGYVASKAAINHLTRSWAIEFAEHDIRVNCIMPGPTHSRLDEQLTPEMRGQDRAQHARPPLRRAARDRRSLRVHGVAGGSPSRRRGDAARRRLSLHQLRSGGCSSRLSLRCYARPGVGAQQALRDPPGRSLGDELVHSHEPGDVLAPGEQEEAPGTRPRRPRRSRCCPRAGPLPPAPRDSGSPLVPVDDHLGEAGLPVGGDQLEEGPDERVVFGQGPGGVGLGHVEEARGDVSPPETARSRPTTARPWRSGRLPAPPPGWGSAGRARLARCRPPAAMRETVVPWTPYLPIS